MPAGPLAHSGLDLLDFSVGGIRADISPALKASMWNRSNFTSAIPMGQMGGGGVAAGQGNVQLYVHSWTESRLNPRTVTETDAGINAAATSFVVSSADGALILPNWYLSDNAQDPSVAEWVFVTSVSPATPDATHATINITRGANGTTAASHATGAVWSIVARTAPQGSSMGPDMSRIPGMKFNLIQTQRADVRITGAMVSLAKFGMYPGVNNVVGREMSERIEENLSDIEKSLLVGVASPLGTATEAQTLWGSLAWGGRTNPVPNATTQPFNAGGAPLDDTLVNAIAINLDAQGAEVPNAAVLNGTNVDKLGRVYRDQFRLSQDEQMRGYYITAIKTSLGERLVRFIKTNYMPSTAVQFLDLNYCALIPFLDRLCFLISSPTMDDADVLSLITAYSYEQRNTGTDFGERSKVAYNFT